MATSKGEERKRTKYYADPFALPPECDPLCLVRPCFHKYENKGSYAVGRGYTTYHADFRPVCATRQHHGCPSCRRRPGEPFDTQKLEALLKTPRMPRRIRKELHALLLELQKVHHLPVPS